MLCLTSTHSIRERGAVVKGTHYLDKNVHEIVSLPRPRDVLETGGSPLEYSLTDLFPGAKIWLSPNTIIL